MRYLKKFSLIKESMDLDQLKDELQEFCEWNLATLLDEGYEFILAADEAVPRQYVPRGVSINIKKIEYFGSFNWDDVKDYIIPFISVLNDNYDIISWSRTERLVRFEYINYRRAGILDYKYVDEHDLDNFELDGIKLVSLKINK